MIRKEAILAFIFIICTSWMGAQSIFPKKGIDYHEGVLILKIKEEHAKHCFFDHIALKSLQSILRSTTISKIEKLFPKKKLPNLKQLEEGFVNLSTIYKIYFSKEVDLVKMSSLLTQFDEVEYAELDYIQHLANQPNDPRNIDQWYLDAISAHQAWGINQGDTEVVIGIVDAGADMDHEDLIDNIAVNEADPINGIDDDGDGFVDNYRGWDLANNDNDPNKSVVNHGSNVAGIASASTNNNIGISGCGYNSRLLIVRIDNETTGQLTAAYQGIVYAADHGAFIINNSWGSQFYSQFAQDVVNYAAINRKALVIGASGNDGEERRFYPAAYENVLSVGSTIENDTVKASSNYGYWLDLFAPGERMLTTMDGSTVAYGINGGTSMAAPVVAGVAALVKAQFPTYTAEQIKEQLINSADKIEGINGAIYRNKLGAGRVNAHKALIINNLPGIVLKEIKVTDRENGILNPLENIYITGILKNILNVGANNLKIRMRDLDGFLSPINDLIEIDTLRFNQEFDFSSEAFSFRIDPSVGNNQRIEMEATVTADNYSKKIFFSFYVNTDYLTVNRNQIEVTLTSKGRQGYSDENNSLGRGIRYKGGNSLLFEGSFIMGNSPNYVLDDFRALNGNNNDFLTVEGIVPFQSIGANFSTNTSFNDQNEPNSIGKLSVIRQNHFLDIEGMGSTFIETYGIKNNSSDTIRNLYAGLIMDWDVVSFDKNKIIYDERRAMSITYATDTNIYCGIKLLSRHSPNNHHALDNGNNPSSGINLSNGFSDLEKYTALSQPNNSAGNQTAEGNDVLDLNSIGPMKIDPDSMITASFAIIIAENLSSLSNKADSIQLYFDQSNLDQIQSIPSFNLQNSMMIYPNPTNNKLNVEFHLTKTAKLQGVIASVNGQYIREIPTSMFTKGNHLLQYNVSPLKSGVYFIQFEGSGLRFEHKFVVNH
ncbi:MAG: hypothetical protein CMO34_01740 [Verrucomicrobia bacterium]|nr:hypothetical protein [Verrucomicrobiota bacterium]